LHDGLSRQSTAAPQELAALQPFSPMEPTGIEPVTSCLQSSSPERSDEPETPEISGYSGEAGAAPD